MNKQRWAELSGLEKEESILILEGNQAITKEDISEMISVEMAKVLEEYELKKAHQDIAKGKIQKNVSATLGFTGIGFAPSNKSKAFSQGAGRTIGFGGPGFM